MLCIKQNEELSLEPLIPLNDAKVRKIFDPHKRFL